MTKLFFPTVKKSMVDGYFCQSFFVGLRIRFLHMLQDVFFARRYVVLFVAGRHASAMPTLHHKTNDSTLVPVFL